MKIKLKLILAFLVIILLIGVIGIINIRQDRNIQNIVYDEVYWSISHLDNAWTLMETQEHQEIAANNYLFLEAGLEDRRADYFYEKERLEEIYSRYYSESCEHVKPLLEKYYENMRIYNTKIEEAFKLYEQGADPEVIKEKVKEANRYVEIAHEDALEPIIEHVHEVHIGPAKENIAKEVNNATRLILISISIVIFLSIMVYLSISRSVSKPIAELRDATKKISKEKLDTKIEIKSNDEIGQLASSFNQMTVDLKKSRKDLEKHSKDLENKVKERTEELNKKVEELERFNKMAIDREQKMIDLKKRIKELEGKG